MDRRWAATWTENRSDGSQVVFAWGGILEIPNSLGVHFVTVSSAKTFSELLVWARSTNIPGAKNDSEPATAAGTVPAASADKHRRHHHHPTPSRPRSHKALQENRT